MSSIKSVPLLLFVFVSVVVATLPYTTLDPSGRGTCPGCTRLPNAQRLSPEEFGELKKQFEVFKLKAEQKRILDQLGFENPPKITPSRSNNPMPHYFVNEQIDDDLHPPSEQQWQPVDPDRTERKMFVLAKRTDAATTTDSACTNESNACFEFELQPSALTGRSIESALLWVWVRRRRDTTSGAPLTVRDRNIVVTQQLGDVPVPQRYVAINVTKLAAQWTPTENNRMLMLSGAINRLDLTTTDHRPFLELKHQLPPSRRRRTQSAGYGPPVVRPECYPELFSHCCVQPFYVNFTEIGWSDWVIRPVGFWANYCTGNCRYMMRNAHETMLTHVTNRREVLGHSFDDAMLPCCAPRGELGNLTIVYQEDANTIKQRIITNIVVHQCGC